MFSHVMAVTHEGGRVEFQSLGVYIEVPANAIGSGQTELMKISIITDVAKYLPKRHDEVLVAFGIQCLPDGLQLNLPVRITIPHCASLQKPGEITPILYSGSGEIGKNAIVR